MNDVSALTILTVIVAVSAALLAWFAVDLATTTMAKYKATFTERTKFQAQEFFLFIDPRKLFVANIAVMAIGAALIWALTGAALVAIPTFFLLAMLPRWFYARMRKRRLDKFENQLPDSLMMIAGALRAGLGLSSALAQLVAETEAPISQEFGLLLREQRLGVTLEQSLSNLNYRISTPSTTLVVSAMRIATETGGGLAETLERTAHTVRGRLQLEGKIRALTSQGKLQAWVVGSLPIFLMMVLNKMEPVAMSHLWHTQMGWATLVVIGFFEIMGIYVIRRIIAIDV